MLLRKRIFVYSPKVSDLMSLIRVFPLLGAWHRQDFSILRPLVRLSEYELQDLSSAGVYVAGFTDSAAVNKQDMYDVYIDVPARTFTYAEQAKSKWQLHDAVVCVCVQRLEVLKRSYVVPLLTCVPFCLLMALAICCSDDFTLTKFHKTTAET